MIRERRTKDGRVTYGVRLHRGRGRYDWIGTFPTREDAEAAEGAARRNWHHSAVRVCACGGAFRTDDARAVRCGRCRAQSVSSSDDHWVYYCYDAGGQLLYVGVTSAGVKRFRRHGNERSWWHLVATITVEHHATSVDAVEAERRDIRRLQPPYNSRGLPA